MRASFAFGFTAALLVLASSASGAAGWTVYRDPANGFRVATPSDWLRVPGSPAAALRLATSLEKNGKPQQATLVRAYLADNRQSGEDRVLDGIQFPIPSAAPSTDFFFVKDHLPKGMKSNSTTLNRIGKAFFDGFRNDPTFTLTTGLTHFRLAGGEAVAFQGTALGTSGKKKGFAFYVLLGPGNTEWQFEFRTDGRRLNANSTLFWRIANSLRFI